MEALQFLAAPFAMCVIMVGIHCYLGLHVLAREVVFVDLSLAQVSVLGIAIAIWAGVEAGSPASYALALAATLMAALFFSAARKLEDRVSQEALIGIVYAMASAGVLLILDRTHYGTEVLKESLVGQILWVSWADVIRTALLYALVGIIHYIFRRRLWASSFQGQRSWAGDLLFYSTFGLVITSSTYYAGVLLVFSMLIVPAVLAKVVFKKLKSQLMFGWSYGAAFVFLGLALSYWLNTPSGAFIVVLLSSAPVLVVISMTMRPRALPK